MPAIPIYRSSPISGAQASGVTPQTSRPDSEAKAAEKPETISSQHTQGTYPAAQPGARPPVPTGLAHPTGGIQPTPTRTTQDAYAPPPPQPGAVPMPPGAATHLPPPPKAGESMRQQQPTTTSMPMPPQMDYPPPYVHPYSGQGGSSTSTAPPLQFLARPMPTDLSNADGAATLAHPPGYHQNINAAELSGNQSSAHDHRNESSYGGDSDEGVWDTAKKWAVAAGDGLAAAENEVWKRINKD